MATNKPHGDVDEDDDGVEEGDQCSNAYVKIQRNDMFANIRTCAAVATVHHLHSKWKVSVYQYDLNATRISIHQYDNRVFCWGSIPTVVGQTHVIKIKQAQFESKKLVNSDIYCPSSS